jgi:signal transduction histidine kinase
MLTMDVRTDKPRVLYVDDEAENLHGFKALFRRDYTIFLAESAAKALDILHSEQIEVLVTDQRMPEMTGTDLLEVVAREFPDTIRFMLTGYSDYDPLVEAINKGKVQGYFSKPINPGEVSEQIHRGLGVSRLKERNERLVEELWRAKNAAEEANRAKSDFLANMSHEIRTPLSGLMGVLHLLEAGRLDADQCALVGMALRSGDRLTRLLADLLDLSRIEAGRMPICAESFRLEETLTAVREAFEPLCRDKNLSIGIDIAADTPATLIGDEIRLRQVLFNFVGNALKFSDHGCVAVRVELLPARRTGQVHLLFTVADSGIGIPESKLDLLCKPFTQIARSFTRRHQGAGLGLTISHRLIEAMDGSLTIDSAEGQGTTVSFMVPLGVSPSAHTVDAPSAAEARVRTKAMHLLLVEDDEICRITAQTLLSRMGHAVQAASDGGEALELLRQTRFDCVLMDVQMPTMDGVTATRLIRSGKAGVLDPAVPIVAQTAYAMSGDCDQFLAEGMDAYVSKPLNRQALEDVLGRVNRAS